MQTGPDAAGLGDLIARVRAATGPDRELDVALAVELTGWCRHEHKTWSGWQDDTGFTCDACAADSWGNKSAAGQRLYDECPVYTASLDAALALVKRVLPDRRVHFSISTGGTLSADASLSINRTPDEIAGAHLMRPEDDPEEGFEGYVMEGALHSAASAPLAVILALLTALAAQRETGGEHVG